MEKKQLEKRLIEFQENENILRQRLILDELVASISSRFVNISLNHLENEISQALGKVGKYLGVERCYFDKLSIQLTSNNYQDIIIDDVYGWCVEGLEPHLEGFKNTSLSRYKWLFSKLFKNEIVIINRVCDLPDEAKLEKELWGGQGAQSVLVIPLYENNSLVGMMGFNCEQAEKYWTNESLNLIRIIGEIILNVLYRKQNEETLRYTLSVEQLVTSISYRFINASHEKIDTEINRALKILAQYIQVDRSYFALVSEDILWIKKMYTWFTEQESIGSYIQYHMDYLGPYQWALSQLKMGNTVVVPKVAVLPDEAAAEKKLWMSQGRQSVLILPLFESGYLVGYLGFDSKMKEKRWSETDILLLKLVGEIFI